VLLLDEAAGRARSLVRASLKKISKKFSRDLSDRGFCHSRFWRKRYYFADDIVLMNEGRIVKKVRLPICAKDQPTRSFRVHQRPARDREFMNRIRKQESRKGSNPNISRFLVSCCQIFS